MSKGLGAAARFPREQRERSSGTASAGRAGSAPRWGRCQCQAPRESLCCWGGRAGSFPFGGGILHPESKAGGKGQAVRAVLAQFVVLALRSAWPCLPAVAENTVCWSCAWLHPPSSLCCPTTEELPCETKVCQNGGTCQEANGTAACMCQPGYAGGDCETGGRWRQDRRPRGGDEDVSNQPIPVLPCRGERMRVQPLPERRALCRPG